jgi:hypothetical protein
MMSMENHVEQIREHNYLLQTCEHCKKELRLSEGDIIFDNKWYHKDCFNDMNKDSKISGDT